MLLRIRVRSALATALAAAAFAASPDCGTTTFAVAAAAIGGGASPRPAVRLVYERAPSAPDCPDAETVMDSVRARLGYDPFREPAAIVVRAVVARDADELSAVISLLEGGVSQGGRHLASQRADCTELSSAMELALSIAIDPLSIGHEPQAAALPGPPTLSPSRAPESKAQPVSAPTVIVVAARAPSPPSAPKAMQATIGVAGNVGASISPSLGVAASVGLRASRWSVALEGRADFPRARSVDSGGSIRASMVAATAVPCLHLSVFGACALATAAALRGSGHDLDNARRVTTSLYALGARIMGELPATASLRVRAHLDILAPLVRTTLTVGNEAEWISPPLSAAGGVDAVILIR